MSQPEPIYTLECVDPRGLWRWSVTLNGETRRGAATSEANCKIFIASQIRALTSLKLSPEEL